MLSVFFWGGGCLTYIAYTWLKWKTFVADGFCMKIFLIFLDIPWSYYVKAVSPVLEERCFFFYSTTLIDSGTLPFVPHHDANGGTISIAAVQEWHCSFWMPAEEMLKAACIEPQVDTELLELKCFVLILCFQHKLQSLLWWIGVYNRDFSHPFQEVFLWNAATLLGNNIWRKLKSWGKLWKLSGNAPHSRYVRVIPFTPVLCLKAPGARSAGIKATVVRSASDKSPVPQMLGAFGSAIY